MKDIEIKGYDPTDPVQVKQFIEVLEDIRDRAKKSRPLAEKINALAVGEEVMTLMILFQIQLGAFAHQIGMPRDQLHAMLDLLLDLRDQGADLMGKTN